MITFNGNKNVYIYSERVDMRMGLNKMQILVVANFTKIEIRHSVFVFCANNQKTKKMYYEDDYGSWLLQSKLFDGKYKWPKGLEVIESKKKKEEYSYY